MPALSVVIITYNEERNIQRCLESVKELADEIVVVDSLSTDNTRNIAERYGAVVISQPFLGHVKQKNLAMRAARHDWVLSLDADEALDDELRDEIIRLKPLLAPGQAYRMNRLTNYCGHWVRHSGWYPDWKTRLWHRQEGSWGGVNPHDRVEPGPGVLLKQLKGMLLHYSFYSIDQHIDQIQKFAEISAREAFDKGKKVGFIEIVLYPIIFFIKRYIFRFGFLDGFYGFVICANSAYFKLLRHVKLRELYRTPKA